jgi:hypothetical protein
VLNERTRRLLAAVEAETLGYGGVSLVARATGVSRRAITAGLAELKSGGVVWRKRRRREFARLGAAGRRPPKSMRVCAAIWML